MKIQHIAVLAFLFLLFTKTSQCRISAREARKVFKINKQLDFWEDNLFTLVVASDIRIDSTTSFCTFLKDSKPSKKPDFPTGTNRTGISLADTGSYSSQLRGVQAKRFKKSLISCPINVRQSRSNLALFHNFLNSSGVIESAQSGQRKVAFAAEGLSNSTGFGEKFKSTKGNCLSLMDINDELYDSLPCPSTTALPEDVGSISERSFVDLLNDVARRTLPDAPVVFGGALLRSGVNSSKEGEHLYEVLLRAIDQSRVLYGNRQLFPYFGSADFSTNGTYDARSENTCSNRLLLSFAKMLRRRRTITTAEARNIERCAFYSRYLGSTKQLTLIFLNTFLYSKDFYPQTNTLRGGDDPCKQFEFLRDELEIARKRRSAVVIVGDLAPVLNVSSVINSRSADLESSASLMLERYQSILSAILSDFSDVITFQLYSSSFSYLSVIVDDSLGSPVMLVPSSAAGGTHGTSSYLIFDFVNEAVARVFVRVGHRVVASTYWDDFLYVLKSEMQPPVTSIFYSLDQLLGIFRSTEEMRPTLYRLYYDNSAWEAFSNLQRAVAGAVPGFVEIMDMSYAMRSRFICTMLSATPEKYNDCIRMELFRPYIGGSIGTVCIVLMVLSGATTVCAIVYVVYKYRRMKTVLVHEITEKEKD